MTNITKQQLRSIVADYAAVLPWSHLVPEALVRSCGPFLQAITFERLSGGDYRPMNFVQVLVAPDDGKRGRVDFLAQTLQQSPHVLSLRSHHERMPAMVRAMEVEFVPAIREPLDVEQTLRLCEESAVPTCAQVYAMAAVNAYLGRYDTAQAWCDRFDAAVNRLCLPWQDWQFQQKAFLSTLQEWIADGSVGPRLDEILKSQLSKWGV